MQEGNKDVPLPFAPEVPVHAVSRGAILAQQPRLGPVTVTVAANNMSRVRWSRPIPSATG